MDDEETLIHLAKLIFDEHFAPLPDWDFDFVISILSNMNYRRNKIKWSQEGRNPKG